MVINEYYEMIYSVVVQNDENVKRALQQIQHGMRHMEGPNDKPT